MESCAYRTLLETVNTRESTPCGPSHDYPGDADLRVQLKDCSRDVTTHLATLGLSGDGHVNMETKLLQAPAGEHRMLSFHFLTSDFMLLFFCFTGVPIPMLSGKKLTRTATKLKRSRKVNKTK